MSREKQLHPMYTAGKRSTDLRPTGLRNPAPSRTPKPPPPPIIWETSKEEPETLRGAIADVVRHSCSEGAR